MMKAWFEMQIAIYSGDEVDDSRIMLKLNPDISPGRRDCWVLENQRWDNQNKCWVPSSTIYMTMEQGECLKSGLDQMIRHCNEVKDV